MKENISGFEPSNVELVTFAVGTTAVSSLVGYGIAKKKGAVIGALTPWAVLLGRILYVKTKRR